MQWWSIALLAVGGTVLALFLAVWLAARMFLAALFREF